MLTFSVTSVGSAVNNSGNYSGSGFTVKAMKEGLYFIDKYPVHPLS